MIFLNFKTYPQTTDQKAVRLCRLIQSTDSLIPVIPCLQAADIYQIAQTVKLPLWVQHLDPIELGQATGFIAPQAVKQDGAKGTLLNHSEHPLDFDVIVATLALCRRYKLKVMVIASDLDSVKKITALKPDYLGFEDPQLIGGPIPMVQAHPDLIKKAVALSRQPLIVGGGIRSTVDVQTALDLGASGVLVASEFAKSTDPGSTLKDLIKGFVNS